MDNTEKIMFDLPKNRSASIKVIGVGGGGSNAVNYMFEEGILGVDFVICNTDAQSLNNSPIPNKIQLGASITEGLGAGANPEVGKQAALESAEDIKAILDSHTKMVFITAGMGGGTGTGAAPVIASMAKEAGILTVGIVTVPFYFEGNRRMEQAESGVEQLQKSVDSLIVINNDKLRELYGNLGFKTGFAKADEVLAIAAKGIAEVITNHYKQNIDLRDAKTVLADSGTAIMGSAVASGPDKAKKAIIQALDSPLLNNSKITGAKNVLLLIVSGAEEITIDEIGVVNDHIQTEAGFGANIIMGIGEDEQLDDAVQVTIVATGFAKNEQKFSREERKNVHTLLEEQAITKTFSVEKPDSINTAIEKPITETVKTENRVEQKTQEHQVKQKNLFSEEEKTEQEPSKSRVVHTLFDKQRDKKEKSVERENTMSLNVDSQITQDQDKMTHEKEDFQKDEEKIFNKKQNTFNASSVDYGFEVKIVNDKQESPAAETNEEKNLSDPFDIPISNQESESGLLKTIEVRRQKLKSFNYKFKQRIKNIEDVERIPAYKRQGIKLTESDKKRDQSNCSLEKDRNDEIRIREDNSFLSENSD